MIGHLRLGSVALGALLLFPAPSQAQRGIRSEGAGNQAEHAPVEVAPPQAPYDALTNARSEIVNFLPEPVSGLAFDADGQVWAVNPYNHTVVVYSGVTGQPDRIVETGFNPISIEIYDPVPADPSQRKLLVVCHGTHALFVHDALDGSIEGFVKLDSEPADMVLDGDNDRLYVSCRGDNLVDEIDLATFEVIERYEITCGERPLSLCLDRGVLADPADNRVYVAASITGNNSITIGPGGNGGTVGKLRDLDGDPSGGLPDHDVFRIDPTTGSIQEVVKNAGSVIQKIARNPDTGELWILSFDSNNKDETIDSEPKLQGKVGINQLKIVSGLDALSSLITAGDGIDLDDFDPNNMAPDYDAARSINQARSLDFLSRASLAPGWGFVSSPMSDVIALVNPSGDRFVDFNLPPKAQCFDVDVFPLDENLFVALCLGTMSIEVFSWNPYNPNPIASLPIGDDPTPPQIRRGRDLFLDGQRSKDARFGCYSCHPSGGADQLGWMLRGDPCDQKDVMVTQSLFSISDTFPHHWRGERDLEDFRKAFVGLLGAPEALDPTDEEIDDFIVFMQSLQAPANPLQNPRRVLDDFLVEPAIDGSTGSAVQGQDAFQDVVNFNGRTCASCHILETGSDSGFLEEVGSLSPRASVLEAAHLRQLQHKGLRTVFLDLGGEEPREVNQNGFGVAHDGGVPTLFHFIVRIQVFFALNPQERRNVFHYVRQFDQGISPAVHWACRYFEADAQTVTDIREILLDGAVKGWNDVAAIGSFDSGSGFEPARWLYDPSGDAFVPEDASQPTLTWDQMQAETEAGRADHVFLGLPLGNGPAYVHDFDNDSLVNSEEIVLGTGLRNPDSDGDGWLDGHEDANGDDPTLAQVLSGDDTPPELDSSTLDFATSRLAKYHVTFSEDVTYSVTYQVKGGGGPVRTFERDYFSREDTFVLTHSEPSTPTLAPIDFEASITMTDRNDNTTGPVPLEDFTPTEAAVMLPPFPLSVHVAEMEWLREDRLGSTLDAEVRIKIDLNYNAPDFFPAPDQMVFSIVTVEDPATGHFEKTDDFLTSHETSFDILDADGNVIEYVGEPGAPWILSPLTDANGETTIAFQQPNLLPGQTVKVSVMGVVFETEAPDGHVGTVYDPVSLFQMTPLFLEDSQEIRLDF